VWERSIDADVTGEPASLEAADSPYGYFTTPLTITSLNAVGVALDAGVVVLDADDGSTRTVQPAGGITVTTQDVRGTNALLAATDIGRPASP
jgi:hypothetical protein